MILSYSPSPNIMHACNDKLQLNHLYIYTCILESDIQAPQLKAGEEPGNYHDTTSITKLLYTHNGILIL